MSANLKIHEETCTAETLVKAKQTAYGKPTSLIDELIAGQVLSEDMRDFCMTNFIVYDIEVVQNKVEEETRLIPISIAVASTFTEDRYFERKSSLPEDGDLMVSDFMDYLTELNTIYQRT